MSEQKSLNSNTNTCTAHDSDESAHPSNKSLERLVRWTIFRIPALALWYWLIALRSHQLAFPLLRWLWTLAFLPVLWCWLHPWTWKNRLVLLWLPLYDFIGIPAMSFFTIIRYFINILRAIPKVFHVTRSAVVIGFSIVLFFLFLVLALSIHEGILLIVIGIAQVILVNLFILSGLRWACDPIGPLLRGVSLLSRFIEQGITKLCQPDAPYESDSSRGFAEKVLASSHRLVTKYLVGQPEKSGLVSIMRRAIGPLFAAGFVILFLLVVTGYGVSYYAIQNATGALLGGIGSNPSLGVCWYYSLSIATTAPMTGVTSLGSYGLVLQALELTSTVMLLTIFFSMFSFSMGEHGRESLDKLGEYPQKIIAKIEKWQQDIGSATPALGPGQGNSDQRDAGTPQT